MTTNSNRVSKRSKTLQASLKSGYERLASDKSPLPPGYIFVAKGDVYVTRHCRELTIKSNRVVWIVFDKRTNERLGLRCPQDVFQEVEKKALATSESRRLAVCSKEHRDVELARLNLLRLFPRIPPEVAESVLKHGFAKGSGRVGRSTTLTDDSKVTLAVVAHARHTMTQYDSILRKLERDTTVGLDVRKSARDAIKNDLEKVLVSWRKVVQQGRRTSNSNKPIANTEKKKSTQTKINSKVQTKTKDKLRVIKNTSKRANPKAQNATTKATPNAMNTKSPIRNAAKVKFKAKKK